MRAANYMKLQNFYELSLLILMISLSVFYPYSVTESFILLQ